MVFKGVLVVFVVAAVLCSVQGLPRDSSMVKTEELQQIGNEIAVDKKEIELEPTTTAKVLPEINIPSRLACEYEEATEALVCQEHCLPKGYSYGLCVGFKCSCI